MVQTPYFNSFLKSPVKSKKIWSSVEIPNYIFAKFYRKKNTSLKNGPNHWQIQGGHQIRALSKLFHLHPVFGKISKNNGCPSPTFSVGPPSLGNPGSATMNPSSEKMKKRKV